VLRSLSGVTVLYLLVLLLAGTSPVGTGRGVHRDQLVDLLVPHVHFPEGAAALTDRPPRPLTSDTSSGPSLGAGVGADGASLGMALTPPLPGVGQLAIPADARRLECVDALSPGSYADAPPDPPPPAAA